MTAWQPSPLRLDLDATDRRLPVLALHCAASSGRQWQGLSDYLRGHYRVIAPDLPKHVDAGLRAARDIRDIAETLLEPLASFGEPVHIVGHAHGAAVALELALSRPGIVRSLTLIEPSTFHLLRAGDPTDQMVFDELVTLAEQMAGCLAAAKPTTAMRAYIDFWYGAGAWSRTSSALRDHFTLQADQVVMNLAALLAESWPVSRCRWLACPTLAVMALESPVAGLRTTEIVAEAIPGARLVMIPDAGHMVPLTDPHILDPLIASHLKSADRMETKRPSWRRAA